MSALKKLLVIAGLGGGAYWVSKEVKAGKIKLPKLPKVPKLGPSPKPSPMPGASGGTGLVTPPGTPQPPGIVIPPPVSAPATDPVHSAAADLLTYLNTNPVPSQSPIAAVSNFQGAFNRVSTSTTLAVDGLYGAKTQAALQAIITPAVAPANFFPASGATSAVPSTPAAPPDTSVDVNSAAEALVSMGSIPKASISAVTTFQHAYNSHSPTQQLTEDGKYGPLSQAALQSVLNFNGGGEKAPNNPYGAAPTTIPTFPG